ALSEAFEHAGPVTKGTFTPDGKCFVSASQDGTAQVWDIQHSRPGLIVLKSRHPFSSACFSPDGRQVLGSDGAIARKFDATTGLPAGKPITHSDPIYRMKA